MSNKNDARILEMKKQIAAKREKVRQIKMFIPLTNLVLNFESNKYNLNVLNKEQLTYLLVKLNMVQMSATDLGLKESVTFDGYSVSSWMTDIKGKLSMLNKKEEEHKLSRMESKLELMLSQEKQVELELDSIESFLND